MKKKLAHSLTPALPPCPRQRHRWWAPWLSTALMGAVGLAPLPTAGWAQAAAPIVSPTGPTVNSVIASLTDAVRLMRQGQWQQAAEVYRRLVNVSTDEARGQARLGLALALHNLGQHEAALKTLDGTLSDDTPLGQAIGALRGQLLLYVADQALAEQGPQAVAPWLEQFQRLPAPPRDAVSRSRLARLSAALTSPTTPETVLRVGVMLPLSGPLAPVGQDILRGLQLGLTAQDGRGGVRLELLPVDTFDAASARTGAESLQQQQVQVVLGPLLGPAVAPAREVLGGQVPLLTLSSDRGVLSGNVHALNFMPAAQAQAVAQAAVAAGRTKLAGLAPATPYGYEVFEAFSAEAKRLGATVVGSSFYNPATPDIGANIRELVGTAKDANGKQVVPFDALLLPAGGGALPLVVAQLSYYDVDRAGVQLLGTALWQDNRLLLPSASAVRGGLFAVPAQDDAFKEKFTQTYGVAPQPLALLGYDAARLLADVGAEQRRTNQGLNALLQRPEGFYGSGGFFRFMPSGVTERGLQLVRVSDQFVVESPALRLPPLPLPDDLLPSASRSGWLW